MKNRYFSTYSFRGEEALQKIRQNDKIKNDFAERNKINILRISFRQRKKIEKILEDYFENNKGSDKE